MKNLSPVKIPLLLLILLISVGCSFLGSQFSPTNTPLPPFERPERTFTKTPEILSTKVELTPTSTFAPTIVTDFVETWPDSTPEEQGMDSANLAALLQKIQKENLNIHSILVARHGFLVLEAYFPPFERETPHNLYSCTKSVTSAAFGIAFQNGLIDSLDTPVQTFFPDLSLDSEQKKGITLRHLLTMSSGIEWIEPLRSGLSDSWSLYDANSPVQYFFDRAMAAEPGKQFNYNSGGSHLLSMVIENTAGESTDTYTSRELFLPLGISRYSWQKDPQGYTIGGTGLAMTSSDMLKFGQLYLNMGTWKGQSLFSPEWVKNSTRAHIAVSPGIDYGYQWWVRPNGIYNALGWGGQQIIVVPHQDMVIVFTAGIRDASWNTYDDLINGYLLPAVKSAKPISANQEAFGLLQDQISAIANPFPQIPAPLPEIVAKINGKTFVDLNGTHGWSTFTFTFDKPDEGHLDLMYGDKSEELSLSIGLDGIFRVTDTQNYGPVAMKGYWKNNTTFFLTQQFLQEAEKITMSLQFTDQGVDRISDWFVEDHREESEAVLLNR